MDEFLQETHFGRAAIPFEKQVLTFIWFISNQEVMRSVSDRFNVTLSSLERILLRVSGACVDLKQQYIKWPSGKLFKGKRFSFILVFIACGFALVLPLLHSLTHIL